MRYAYRVKAIRGGERSPESDYATVMVTATGTLVSNLAQTPTATATITQQYAMSFRLGKHGQGYEISSVTIDLAAVPSDLTVSLWRGSHPDHDGAGDVQRKVFDFTNPPSLTVGLNKFTAQPGAFAYQNVNYAIVLSGFDTSLSIRETTSDDEDPGGETGATLWSGSRVRGLSETGRWSSSTWRGGSVLRLAVEGSRRDRGILAASYTQPWTDAQEIISIGDKYWLDVTVGAADLYLIRGVSLPLDDTSGGGGFGLPFDIDGEFSLTYASAGGRYTLPKSLSGPAGISEWTAPQGATLAGGKTHRLSMDIKPIEGDPTEGSRGGAILTRIWCGTPDDDDATPDYDTPAADVTFVASEKGDVACPLPFMAVLGEPLDAMVQNLGQTDDGYLSLGGASRKVASQGFTTGSSKVGYRLQGIGVNVEGSDNDDGNAQVPSSTSSVSVAVHADFSQGAPGDKLFDLVSPDEFEAGELSFFEAPRDTTLDPNTSYLLVWSHLSRSDHRLQVNSSNNEDSGALTDFSIADDLYSGADLANLAVDSNGKAMEIAVYGDDLGDDLDEEPEAMVSNLGQTDGDYITAGTATQKLVSQGFTTGSYSFGYRLRGIGVNIEGSDDSNGDAQVPDDASSVSVAVHADSSGEPGDKLFDLVSPASFEAGQSIFDAPPGAWLLANTSYVVVWSHLGGTNHRLQLTSSDSEDLEQVSGLRPRGHVLSRRRHQSPFRSWRFVGNRGVRRALHRAPQRVPGAPQLVPPAGGRPSGGPVPVALRHTWRNVRHVRGHRGLQRRCPVGTGPDIQRPLHSVGRPGVQGSGLHRYGRRANEHRDDGRGRRAGPLAGRRLG